VELDLVVEMESGVDAMGVETSDHFSSALLKPLPLTLSLNKCRELFLGRSDSQLVDFVKQMRVVRRAV
jgi:hypothetical protein